MARIDLEGVQHSYGGVEALQQFDLTWEDGGRYAILGPSGCGKTTMLNIMSASNTLRHGRFSTPAALFRRRQDAAERITHDLSCGVGDVQVT